MGEALPQSLGVDPHHAGTWLPPFPREHGAWFILLGSVLVGPAVTRVVGFSHLTLLGIAYTALLGRAALRGSRGIDRVWAAFLLGFAAVLAAALAVGSFSPMLLGAGAAGAVLQGAHILLERKKLQRHLGAELLGIGLLTIACPASLSLGARDVDPRTLGLVAANTLFFLATVPYLRARVFGPKNPAVWSQLRFGSLTIALSGAVLMGASAGPAAALTFLPQVGRAAWLVAARPSPPKSVARLGYLEVASTAFYVVALGLLAR